MGEHTTTRNRLGAILVGLALMGLVFAPAAGATVGIRPDSTSGTNGPVYAILEAGGRIYVGGSFTAAVAADGVSTPRKNLMALDAATGMLDPTFKPESSGEVDALATDGSTLYVGGKFATIGGLSRKNLAAVHLTTGVAVAGWKANANGRVKALAAGNGLVYVGGAFTTITDSTGRHPRYNLAAINPGTGSVDLNWDARVAGEDPVRSLVLSPDRSRLFLAGDFTQVSGQNRSRMAAVNATSAALDQGFVPSSASSTYGLTTDSTRVYAAIGGSGGEVRGLSALTGGTQWSVRTNGNVHGVGVFNGVLYVGGHFGGAGSFGGQERYKLAAVNPSSGEVSSFAPRVNTPSGVSEIRVSATHLYIGGHFTKLSGVSQPHFAQLSE
jgi:hypothetical protein